MNYMPIYFALATAIPILVFIIYLTYQVATDTDN